MKASKITIKLNSKNHVFNKTVKQGYVILKNSEREIQVPTEIYEKSWKQCEVKEVNYYGLKSRSFLP